MRDGLALSIGIALAAEGMAPELADKVWIAGALCWHCAFARGHLPRTWSRLPDRAFGCIWCPEDAEGFATYDRSCKGRTGAGCACDRPERRP